ncbi:MAG TPA: hypothetical protein VGD67_05845 [Pseudonocardiaceae bacterium]
MERFSAWATSPDNAVSVLAAAGGVPLEVRLSGTAMRLRPEVLARTVLETARSAGKEASVRLHQELAVSVGVEATRTLERVGLPRPEPERPDDPPEDPDGGFGPVLHRAR